MTEAAAPVKLTEPSAMEGFFVSATPKTHHTHTALPRGADLRGWQIHPGVMTQTTAHITIQIKVAWWLKWYLYGVWTAALLTGATPDADKIARMVLRSFKLKLMQRA